MDLSSGSRVVLDQKNKLSELCARPQQPHVTFTSRPQAAATHHHVYFRAHCDDRSQKLGVSLLLQSSNARVGTAVTRDETGKGMASPFYQRLPLSIELNLNTTIVGKFM
ncbi:hypothetical protein ElyMa_002963500 [Elysia marginata]|uniref:Uncharacterized protein n=1 Tax=Elysia marginata TaxID=1093978 RepID=A0AAV4I8F4_9GAST|nr:hypothetical protein ElyMa_002963500 [Elysia marginata]